MFCKYCGKEINNDSKFCKFCGEEIGEITIETNEEAPEVIQPEVIDSSEVTILDEQIEFEKYAENFIKRRIIGIIFRILFWLAGLYFMFLSCSYSFYMGEIFNMVIKIIFFPFTMIILPIIALITGDFAGWVFWIWFFMMGSYAISTFYGRLRPVV